MCPLGHTTSAAGRHMAAILRHRGSALADLQVRSGSERGRTRSSTVMSVSLQMGHGGGSAFPCALDASSTLSCVSDPRNHHYVPQAYLLGFGDSREQICVRWRMNDDPSFHSNVRNVASERDFYSFVNTGRVDHGSFENELNASRTRLIEPLSC